MQPTFGIQPCSLLSALHRSDLSLPNCENGPSKAQSCSHLQTFLGGPAGIKSPTQHLGDALQPAQAWQYPTLGSPCSSRIWAASWCRGVLGTAGPSLTVLLRGSRRAL